MSPTPPPSQVEAVFLILIAVMVISFAILAIKAQAPADEVLLGESHNPRCEQAPDSCSMKGSGRHATYCPTPQAAARVTSGDTVFLCDITLTLIGYMDLGIMI